MTAEAVIADAVERFHPRVALACSFQKEESVLLDLLFKARPGARVFALDTARAVRRDATSTGAAVEATLRHQGRGVRGRRTRRTGCGRPTRPHAAGSAR